MIIIEEDEAMDNIGGFSGFGPGRHALIWVLLSLFLLPALYVRQAHAIVGEDGTISITIGGEEISKPSVDPPKALNNFDEEIGASSSFSNPYPEIILDEIKQQDLTVSGEIASVRLSGRVKSSIADIVDHPTAKISRIHIEYFEPASSDGGVTSRLIEVAVEQDSSEPKTSRRPFAFKGSFSTTAKIPLWAGDIEVAVRAENLIGNSGYDSFTLHVTTGEDEIDSDDEGFSAPRVLGITNHENTGPGLVNPIRIFIVDHTVTEANVASQVSLFGGREFKLKIVDKQLQLDRPVMALATEFPSDIPNLIQARGVTEPTVLEYKNYIRDFFWVYTTHSPPNYFKYAAGTTVKHEVRGSVFTHLKLNGKSDVEVMTAKNNRQTPDASVEILTIKELSESDEDGKGYMIEMRLKKDAAKDTQKHFRFILHDIDGDPPRGFFTTATAEDIGKIKGVKGSGGHFEAVSLKTVIVAVDGLAYQSVHELLKGDKSESFNYIFKGSANLGKPAYSALPTITFTNWPGVFSGLAPKDHGILGNAFFPREIRDATPFASTGSSTSLQNLSVVRGSLNHRARVKGSLYQNIARAAGRAINAWSVHTFYAYPAQKRYRHWNHSSEYDGPNLYVNAEYFGYNLKYKPHNANAAKALDGVTADYGVKRWEAHVNVSKKDRELDILTLYLPGPDNIAHAVGQRPTDGTENEGFPHGPALPEVEKPLRAIGAQVEKVTDAELEKILDAIDKTGYQHATLFALVSDHGLHAVHNDYTHNIYLPKNAPRNPAKGEYKLGLEELFSKLGMKVWTGSGNIKNKTLVYSPNGGLAHIYIRNEANKNGITWKMPPQKASIEKVARQLYVEAVGGIPLGTGVLKCEGVFRLETSGCYANLSKLKNALGRPPAIFVRVCDSDDCKAEKGVENHFKTEYRWVKELRGLGKEKLEYGSIDDFLETARLEKAWLDFKARVEEMNDKNINGSRSGDILIFMNGPGGYLTVAVGDEFNGWHGGPTVSETKVPLLFNLPSPVITEKSKEILQKVVKTAQTKAKTRVLRNWHMSAVLEEVYKDLRK